MEFFYLNCQATRQEYFEENNKAFVGAWVSDIACGKGLKHVLLASALPQDWPNETNFFNKIQGTFSPNMSDGYTKYLLSVGGSNATENGWTNFLNNPEDTADKLTKMFKDRGIVGIDFDLEGNTPNHQQKIKQLVRRLKNNNPNYIIVYTVLVSSSNTYADLIKDNQMDYVAVMLYNGGMYEANSSGWGCDWDTWAELFLSKCQVCKCSPLNKTCTEYCKSLDMSKLENKIVMAVIIDTKYKKVNTTDMKKAMDLGKKYNASGIYIWVLPGWEYGKSQSDFCGILLTEMRNYNATINNYFDIGTCPLTCNNEPSPAKECDEPSKPCNSKCNKCVATECGKKIQQYTDKDCIPCGLQGQTWWPCNMKGFCECKE
ncbi:MAG: hypothetical protein Edafosvirus12_26 [Edafosvirus sp.]|uniref:GH18 domain-containing protein n=1 Tax=Edafosvirus sp. TaxID=2487765 RepID=A0A3G4ZU61_9VIRU|nr:MAG: hypothetical protein Edafosvirus12_26 [Edafosvirus sp.]